MVRPGRAMVGSGRVIKTLRLALLAAIVATSQASAGEPGLLRRFLLPDWQDPEDLPPRFRNHCSYDVTQGRYYCSDHCGVDYQFYYCSPRSFGCCHVGVGYCGWDGLLRCRP